jgi:predicted nucleotidyltransferase
MNSNPNTESESATEKSLFGLNSELIEQFHQVFRKHPAIQQVLIYGSRARGTHRPNSDIDLTMTGADLTHSEALTIASELDDLHHPYLIDLSIKSQISSEALLRQMDKDGRVFYLAK